MKKHRIDFNHIPLDQREIDKRLSNWGRCQQGANRPQVCPSCRFMQDTAYSKSDGDVWLDTIDSKDANLVNEAIKKLQNSHRAVLNVYYVDQARPETARKKLGIDARMMQVLLSDARLRLISMLSR